MPNQTQKQIQIDWIVNQLEQGKERQDFLQEFTKIYKVKTKTFDNRLKEARELHKSILEARKKENDKTLSKDPEWEKTRSKLLESKKLIYESLGYIILKNKKKVKINGEERTVLDLELSNSRDLKTIWEMMMVGLGEPTTVSKTENKTEISGEINYEYKQALNNLAKAIKNKK